MCCSHSMQKEANYSKIYLRNGNFGRHWLFTSLLCKVLNIHWLDIVAVQTMKIEIIFGAVSLWFWRAPSSNRKWMEKRMPWRNLQFDITLEHGIQQTFGYNTRGSSRLHVRHTPKITYYIWCFMLVKWKYNGLRHETACCTQGLRMPKCV